MNRESVEATANKDITQEVMICNGQRDKSENLFVTWFGGTLFLAAKNLGCQAAIL